MGHGENARSALHFAHLSGIAHCDVKPANILIEEGGCVLLSDYGVARTTENSTAMTMVSLGTLAYMAPEQIRGEDPTPATDIYALSIVLYEMLTGGERPFTGERARNTGSTAEKVRWEHLHLDPPSLRRSNPWLRNSWKKTPWQHPRARSFIKRRSNPGETSTESCLVLNAGGSLDVRLALSGSVFQQSLNDSAIKNRLETQLLLRMTSLDGVP